MTQSEVADVIGVSQVQVSRIESKVFADMKNCSAENIDNYIIFIDKSA